MICALTIFLLPPFLTLLTLFFFLSLSLPIRFFFFSFFFNKKKNRYGSQLDIGTARSRAKHNSATSLQVTSAVLAAVVWAIRNPTRGIVEADELPFDQILSVCRPYVEPVVGKYTNWTPLEHRGVLFDEPLVCTEDPFQFVNFRVL